MRRLTRTDVAKMLGKSVATVRRLEGHVLFPVKDWRGVHRFDGWDVERLRNNPDRMRRWARSRWFERHADRKPRNGSPAPSATTTPQAMRSNARVVAVVSELVECLLECDPRKLARIGGGPELAAALVRAAQELALHAE